MTDRPQGGLSDDLIGLRELRLHVESDLADVYLRAAAHVVQDARSDRCANELLRFLRLFNYQMTVRYYVTYIMKEMKQDHKI